MCAPPENPRPGRNRLQNVTASEKAPKKQGILDDLHGNYPKGLVELKKLFL